MPAMFATAPRRSPRLVSRPPGRPARRPLAATLAAVALGAAALAGCSSDGDSTSASSDAGPSSTAGEESTTTAPAESTLRIMVTNDDGVGSEGIDLLSQALSELPDTEVVVIAPAENQSGSGGKTTDGELVTAETTTASGMDATSVAGFPADSVVWAFDEGGLEELPDLVVSGVNQGQNVGPLVELSGTVGAARAAAARGVPSLAVSAGLADPVDYASAVDLAVEWVTEHREALLGGIEGAEPAEVWSINVPSCTTGELRGLVEVPTATDIAGRDLNAVDCTSTATDPADDVAAFLIGYASIDEVSPAA